MAVLDGPFLIGKVVEVNYATSRVLLISDLNSKIILVEPEILDPYYQEQEKNFATILYSKDEQKNNKRSSNLYIGIRRYI